MNINLQKDILIRRLKRRIEDNKFSNFESELPKDCLLKLRLIGNSQKDDSQFVSVILNAFYENNIEIVKTKCLSIRTKNHKTHQSVISPEKCLLLERIFSERLRFSNSDEARKSSLSKLIRNSIDNAKRKH